jgi:hypothetical protein
MDVFDSVGRTIAHIKDVSIRANEAVYQDQGFAEYYIIPLIYRLLATRSKATLGNEASIYQEALRIALILFLAEVRRAFRIYPVVSRTQVAKLRLLLQNSLARWEGLGMLRLWIVATGAMEAVAQDEKAWFLRLLQEILDRQGNSSLGTQKND